MEVGDQPVQHLEPVAGIDENVRPTGGGGHGAVLGGPAFDGAAGGGADADDPSAAALGLIDEICRLLWDDAVFAVHLVALNGVFLHGSEGAKPHMECYVSNLYTHCLHTLQKLRSEVKSGGGGGGAAVDLGVDGLIALPVLQLLLDVGG